jgi:alpha-ketoglutarate-dependent taurine dioxygenase
MHPIERQLTASEQAALTKQCDAIAGQEPRDQAELVELASSTPPSEDLAALGQYVRDHAGVASGLVVLTDVPEGRDPLVTIAVLGRLLGPITRYEGEGSHIIEIKDDPAQDGGRPSFANSREFFLHTDLSYAPEPPPYLLMHSITNESSEGGFSLFADIDDILGSLATDAIAELSKAQFMFPAPSHYRGTSVVTFPILVQNGGDTALVRFRRDNLRANTRAGIRAVISLLGAMQEHTIEHHLKAGSVVMVPNRRYLHGRTAYVASKAARRPRHLNRMYVSI